MWVFIICAAIMAAKAMVPELKYHRVMKKVWRDREENPSMFLQMAARDPWLRRKWERAKKQG